MCSDWEAEVGIVIGRRMVRGMFLSYVDHMSSAKVLIMV